MIIDAHQHVWDLTKAEYSWLGPEVPLWNRTFEFAELRPQLKAAGVSATVLVQSADNAEDTALMRAVADEFAEVAAIVAYAPLGDAAAAATALDALADDRRIVGVRNLIHTLPDPDWILRPEVDEGLSVLEERGLTFDYVSVLPRHLEHVPVLATRHPDLKIVIDHLSSPPFGTDREPWWSLIAAAAEHPLVHAKVSGLYPGADSENWSSASLRPYLDHALHIFGPGRLMYGGDWPISIASGGYQHVFEELSEALADLDQAAAEAIWSGTAAAFYGIDPARLEAATQAWSDLDATNDQEATR